MKENNDIDKLLRASLDSYHPAPKASGKEKFLEEAADIVPGKNRPGAYWKPVTIAIILVALTGSLLWYLSSSDDTNAIYKNESSTTINDEDKTRVNQDIASTEKTDKPDSKQSSSLIENNVVHTEENITVTRETSNKISSDEKIKSPNNFASRATKLQSEPPATNASEQMPVPEPAAVKQDYIPYPVPSSTNPNDSLIKITPLAQQDSIVKNGISQQDSSGVSNPVPIPQKGGRMMLGLFYGIEKIYNAEESGKIMHSVGVGFQYRPFNPKYVVRIGAGINISPGSFDYGVDYNEFLGTYNHLDSVSFILAADNFHLLPNYHETQREVFDTAVRTQYLTTDKRFEYLYIPVMLGYDFVRKEHFTFGLRAGPSLSVLLNKKQDNPEFYIGRNQVVQVNLLTPLRNVMNWQVRGGLNFTIISKDNYFIELEPAFSWYFDQLSGEDEHKKNPYSVGLRMEIGILTKKPIVKE